MKVSLSASCSLRCVSSGIVENDTVTAFTRDNVGSYRGLITNWLHEEGLPTSCNGTGSLEEQISPLPDLPPLELCDPDDPSPSVPHL